MLYERKKHAFRCFYRRRKGIDREKIMTFLQEHWYIVSVLIGAVLLIGAIRKLELALRSHRYAGCLPPWQRIPAGDILPAGCSIDCSEYLGIYAEIKEGLDKNGSLNEL